MTSHNFDLLVDEVKKRQTLVQDYLFSEENRISFKLKHLEDAVYSYLKAGGKSLRSAVMMFACGAVGGEEETALPAAAAIELYHTFTLVHDDIIDRDEIRRGVPTVHHDFAQRAKAELHFDDHTAQHYGLAIAILAGDLQQGWAASLLPDLHHRYGLPPELALNLIKDLFRYTQNTLINGETTDILQSEMSVDQITEQEVLDMLWEKTGVLYEFAGRAGAAIGLKQADTSHPTVKALADFTSKCGLAFQIQDDVLGIVGDEKRIGKPVGSDIREGKRTVIVLNSLSKMDETERTFTLNTLGNASATDTEIQNLIALLEAKGGIQHAQDLARGYVDEALSLLDTLAASQQKELLKLWAHYIVDRDI